MEAPWLTTERLALRRFGASDLDWLVSLYDDPDVMRHLGGPQPAEKVATMLETRVLRYYDEHVGLGIWLTLERDRPTRRPVRLPGTSATATPGWTNAADGGRRGRAFRSGAIAT